MRRCRAFVLSNSTFSWWGQWLAGVPGRWWEEKDRRITLGIVDPMTGRDAVRFAMQTAQEGGRTVLFAGE